MAPTQSDQIAPGYDVYGSEGDKIGSVAEVSSSYFVVEKGFFLPTALYIPLSAVTSVGDDEVRLNVAKDQIDSQGWDAAPNEGDDVSEAVATEGRSDSTIERSEERLTVDKESVQTGEVRIGKDVVEEEQSVDVPLQREEVHVTRRSVDRPATGETFQEQDISVPVREERVNVKKDARVVEELDVEKTVVEDTERVTETVKREEFRVDADVDRSEDQGR